MTRFGLFLVLLAACEVDVPLVHDSSKGQGAGGAGGAVDAGRTCQENQDCGASGPSGLYCAKGFGGCRGPGVCEKRQPLRCAGAPNLAYVPVCGCDEVTYFNECLAAANGVPVERSGQCPPAPGHCTDRCAPPGFCTRLSCDPGPDLCYVTPSNCQGLAARLCHEQRCVDLCQPIPNRQVGPFELGCP